MIMFDLISKTKTNFMYYRHSLPTIKLRKTIPPTFYSSGQNFCNGAELLFNVDMYDRHSCLSYDSQPARLCLSGGEWLSYFSLFLNNPSFHWGWLINSIILLLKYADTLYELYWIHYKWKNPRNISRIFS